MTTVLSPTNAGHRLRVRDLSCRRGGRLVFSGLSFEIAGGEVLMLRGPNGSGKTTLLRCLAGLLPPASGAVEWSRDGGRSWEEADPGRYAVHCGHADGVKRALNVRETVAYWARLYGTPDRVDPTLADFALTGLSDLPVAFLSAGQRRRLGLTRMRLHPGPLWLLDEPTVSLDEAAVTQVKILTEAHCAGGGLAIIASHVDFGVSAGKTLMFRNTQGEPA